VLKARHLLFSVLLSGQIVAMHAQSAKQLVQQAVQTELNASANDQTHWLYFEKDRELKRIIAQWVAETQSGSVQRVVERNGHALSESQQRGEMDRFVNDTRAQAKQRKNAQHDDEQAAELLKMLPQAFIWSDSGTKGDEVILHFKPDPHFNPPDMKSRVFAAMEGDIAVDKTQHRIASLKGRMTRDVKFGGGLLGELHAGGTFDVERREIGKNQWQITETHVHIQGHALIFKTISVNEDEEESKFTQLPRDISLRAAEAELLKK
jgi:hypothetical protein